MINELRNEMMTMKIQFSNSDKVTSDSSMNQVKEEEIHMFDLDSVEAGMRRVRDPLIFERNTHEVN